MIEGLVVRHQVLFHATNLMVNDTLPLDETGSK